MPRSGTTLTEQIISSHKDVHGAGELNYMTDAVEHFVEKNKNEKNISLENFTKY